MSPNNKQKGKVRKEVGNDRNGVKLYIGDFVDIEQAWEDEAGHYHDEFNIEISGVYPNGTLKFRFGNWKTRSGKDQMIQAFLNKCDWLPSDVEKSSPLIK